MQGEDLGQPANRTTRLERSFLRAPCRQAAGGWRVGGSPWACARVPTGGWGRGAPAEQPASRLCLSATHPGKLSFPACPGPLGWRGRV